MTQRASMNSDRWQVVKEVFYNALDLEDGDRQRLLRELEPETREEVEALLKSASEAGGLLDSPLDTDLLPSGVEKAGPALPAPSPVDRPAPLTGVTVGPYQVGERIGRGGMGDVYRARRVDGLFDREVAVKVVRDGADTQAVLDRFAAERRILGSLEHPGIARLISAGSEAEGPAAGRPWLALELVDGVPITDATRELALEDRVRLMVDVAEAVHHAHRRLVVHRDLKPSNVMVATGEKGRTVKLLDFGIAKLLDPGVDSHLTSIHERRPMTRAYAAPEQVLGRDVTTATDVYGLGLVLFEVLTAARPFNVEQDVRGLEGDILEVEAPRLSAVSVPEEGGVEPRRLRGDLDVICGKALTKEPEARYASAEAFGADLERWLAGEPIEARAPSRSYRAGRFVKRHRAGVMSAALALLVAVAGVSYYTVRLAQERDRAELSASRAERTSGFLESLFADPDPTGANPGDRTARELLEAGGARLREDLADEPAVLAAMLATVGRVERALGQYADADSFLTDAVRLYEQTGADPQGQRDALLELANLRYRTKDYEHAERYSRSALRLDSLHRMEPSERLAILNTLALVYSDTGRLEDAALVLREVVVGRREIGGDEVAVDLASNMSNLGIILIDLGKLDEAETLLDEALDLTIQSRGEDHPYVAFALNSRSGVHEARHNYRLAIADMDRALSIAEAAFGLDHPFIDHARGVKARMVAKRDSAARHAG